MRGSLAAESVSGVAGGSGVRDLSDFTLSEWARLLPVQHAFKQARNDYWQRAYDAIEAAHEREFLAACRPLTGRRIAVLIAFEQPLALQWLLSMAERNLVDCPVLVFDNSRRSEVRPEIEAVCRRFGAAYLGLPPNRTRHVNRSHGMAMNWVYRRIVCKLEPELFAFIDHDLLPVKCCDFAERLGHQACFGLLNESAWGWSLWAGYGVFRYAGVRDLPMNFLYDFSRGLDTGGRNFRPFYSTVDRSGYRFASNRHVNLVLPREKQSRVVQVVDDRWLHIESISYNDNFAPKLRFFEELMRALESGEPWEKIAQGSTIADPGIAHAGHG